MAELRIIAPAIGRRFAVEKPARSGAAPGDSGAK